MKQKLLLYFIVFTTFFGVETLKAATDTTWYRSLVISEIKKTRNPRGDNFSYLELTNVGDSTLKLEDYWLQSGWGGMPALPIYGDASKWSFMDSIHLAPGESYTYLGSNRSTSLDLYGNVMYPNGYTNVYMAKTSNHLAEPETDGTIYPGSQVITGGPAVCLFYRGDTSSVPGIVARDSSQIDQFWFKSGEIDGSSGQYPIAGVITSRPHTDYTYVRKFKYKKGNINFDQSRGNNGDDSEWIPIPLTNILDRYSRPFTTWGNHGSTTELSLTPRRDDITVDVANKVINFPYGIRRDSVFWNFDIGDNHAWEFQLGPDTSQWYVTDGDTLEFIVCGNEVSIYKLGVHVSPKPADEVKVRPLYTKNPSNGNWNRRYIVSDGFMPMDSVGEIPFATPIDTLLKYLVVEDGASYDFIWKDGQARPEIMDGDQLKITAGSKTKTYKLSVYNYIPDHNADLNTIYLPGLFMWENPTTYLMTDTLIDFNPNAKDYIVNLPEGTETMPAIVAQAASNRANVYIHRAKNLSGTDEDRMATITVTAEDDTTGNTYRILFNVDRPTPEVQGSLFFTDIVNAWYKKNGANIQIYNPSSDIVDMTQYMIIKPDESKSFDDFWKGLVDGDNEKSWNARILNPSKIVTEDVVNNEKLLTLDESAHSFEVEGKGTYTLVTTRTYPIKGPNYTHAEDKHLFQSIDYVVGGNAPTHGQSNWPNALPYFKEVYGEGYPESIYDGGSYWPFNLCQNNKSKDFSNGASYILAKIKNDSITEGTKPLNKGLFQDNYEVVDVINGIASLGASWTIYDTFQGKDTAYQFGNIGFSPCIHRKQWVYKGNPNDLQSFGNASREGEWLVYGMSAEGKLMNYNDSEGRLGSTEYGEPRFDNHIMVTYAHIPYITSTHYLISTGLEGEQNIYGVLASTSVDVFMQNIIKPDTSMSVVVTDADGNAKTGASQLIDGDKVVSTAANGQSSVNYLLHVGPLNADVSLSAKEGSGIVVDGNMVKDVTFGTTIKELKAKLMVADLSTLLITDGDAYIIPMEMYNRDTTLTKVAQKIDVLVSDKFKVEVSAQDGSSAKYDITFKTEDQVFVLSNMYKVYEEYKNIDYCDLTNVDKFMENVQASPGASLYIINKLGQKRTEGRMQYDDRLVVKKGDMQVIYMLKFNNDNRWQVNTEDHISTHATAAYPNPTQGSVTVDLQKGTSVVMVRNISGQLLQTIHAKGSTLVLDLKGQPGIYFISMLKGNEILRTEKVVKN